MSDNILLAVWRYLVPVPSSIWKGQVRNNANRNIDSLAFMSSEHHRVRDFVVRELPRYAKPIPPIEIANALDLPLEKVIELLDELEKKLTFLYRNNKGEVTWAYPVTVDNTPHQITFSSGEKLNAA